MGLIHLNKFQFRAANDKKYGVVHPYAQNSIFPAFHNSHRMIISGKTTPLRCNVDRHILDC